jgi:hypothetical protein
MSRSPLPAILGLLVTGCHHSGTGSGDLQSAPAPSSGAEAAEGQAVFSWKSGGDPTRGQIEATLSDGRRFTGEFLQLTETATSTAFTPYWAAWTNPGWGAPGIWYAGPATTTAFITEYSGQVLAHLRGPSGQKMRCRFVLKRPEAGLAEGAVGDCQLSTGETVFGAALREGKPR